ncbi:hypothetical protein [Bombilactobacillus thymidiniphilus]|uniref:DUF2383 domain-containing protein n=1 Tax=Bombilactobacillus thymidiniphilus TaxID=2923363 RepID=A0ABY4PCJ2_9LACO|nr:hypothetical protein [Bombilactobacillus thymidiniphilus]UQS83226.1 hypothetical protein MOO47_05465 [Bombilactobacillus thymidiniphilus]
MNKAQQRAIKYVNTLNEIIETTQQVQEKLNPGYQEIKAALEQENLINMDASHYLQIQSSFQMGTDEYAELTKKLQQTKAPARIMGVNMLLVDAYKDYVVACQSMVDSMHDDRTVDQEQFLAAEQAQDKATDLISKHLQKMNQM